MIIDILVIFLAIFSIVLCYKSSWVAKFIFKKTDVTKADIMKIKYIALFIAIVDFLLVILLP